MVLPPAAAGSVVHSEFAASATTRGQSDEGSEGDGAFARLPANSATLMLLNCGLVANCLFERCRPS